jgi:hypothetical protein
MIGCGIRGVKRDILNDLAYLSLFAIHCWHVARRQLGLHDHVVHAAVTAALRSRHNAIARSRFSAECGLSKTQVCLSAI